MTRIMNRSTASSTGVPRVELGNAVSRSPQSRMCVGVSEEIIPPTDD